MLEKIRDFFRMTEILTFLNLDIIKDRAKFMSILHYLKVDYFLS